MAVRWRLVWLYQQLRPPSVYRSVTVAGDVLVHDHLGSLVTVAHADFEHDESQGNPIVAYLQHHGSAKSAPMPLSTEYHLTLDLNPFLYRAPSTNEPYSKVSRGYSPQAGQSGTTVTINTLFAN